MLVLARRFRSLYTTYPTYMITPAKSGQRTRYDTYENIPLAIVTFLHLFAFWTFSSRASSTTVKNEICPNPWRFPR